MISTSSNRAHRLFALLITFAIISILVFTGPAESFILNFSISDPVPFQGDIVELALSANIEETDQLNINYFTVILSGPVNISCQFDIEGNELSSCSGITILKIDSPNNTNFGYGYGYGYSAIGFYNYSAFIDTSILPTGTYLARLMAATPSKTFQTTQQRIVVTPQPDGFHSCSVRAHQGTASINGTTLQSRNKVNMFVPSSNAVKGRGVMIVQARGLGPDRIVYAFQVKKATEVDKSTIVFDTVGKLIYDRKTPIMEQARIVYDKKKETLDVYGNKLMIENMDVRFARC